MPKTRLEAFSDGVVAIIITIMVLELKAPESGDYHSILESATTFINYAISFVFLAIYWVNHHHLLHAAKKTNSAILWANMNLLFWLSLVPFATNWLGEFHKDTAPMSIYAALCLLCGYAYSILQKVIISSHDKNDKEIIALNKNNLKARLSMIFYSLAIIFSLVHSYISYALIVAVSIMWFIPNREIEKLSNSSK